MELDRKRRIRERNGVYDRLWKILAGCRISYLTLHLWSSFPDDHRDEIRTSMHESVTKCELE